ncbi:hypothetical protein Cgig2_024087 [Carnegiea gigantea]|uniref:Uncharacterized protein n=1 Tax=Carnegiea gigantea TaxID=171969 RepID=A0A9Q1K6P7_9CARY|nr:hypothetical protein Cgig2_024087 [Carnegiea gigantea]
MSGDCGNLTLEVSREVGGGGFGHLMLVDDCKRSDKHKRERDSCLRAIEGELEDGGDGKATYTGCSRNLKYDRGMVMAVEGDADVRMFLKGNDEHLYFYGGESDGPKRRTEKDILKWKNGIGEKIEEKLVDTYKKMGCITVMECCNLMLGEYSVELTNNHKLVIKLGQPDLHANLWVYDYVLLIYKTATQQIIHNQLVHQIEAHDMGIVDGKTG